LSGKKQLRQIYENLECKSSFCKQRLWIKFTWDCFNLFELQVNFVYANSITLNLKSLN